MGQELTRILAGGARDADGVRVCPLGCGPDAPRGADGLRDTTCKMATRKSAGRGETMFTPPMPGKCRMYYDERGEPT